MFDLKSVYTLEINNYNRLIDIINNRKKDYSQIKVNGKMREIKRTEIIKYITKETFYIAYFRPYTDEFSVISSYGDVYCIL